MYMFIYIQRQDSFNIIMSYDKWTSKCMHHRYENLYMQKLHKSHKFIDIILLKGIHIYVKKHMYV